jgi:hypothetical protein
MKAYQLKDQMMSWADQYNPSEIRVENNGVQSNLVQYNNELIVPLTQRGIRVVGHHTGRNKWDAQFGVEGMAPWFYNRKIHLPWGNVDSHRRLQPFLDQFIGFPMAERSDLVMASWFGWLAIKDGMLRAPVPHFENRRVPGYVRRRRRIADPGTGKIWHPDDPRRPDLMGRVDPLRPVVKHRMVNVSGEIALYG